MEILCAILSFGSAVGCQATSSKSTAGDRTLGRFTRGRYKLNIGTVAVTNPTARSRLEVNLPRCIPYLHENRLLCRFNSINIRKTSIFRNERNSPSIDPGGIRKFLVHFSIHTMLPSAMSLK